MLKTKIIIWLIVIVIVIAGIWWGTSRKPAEEEVVKIGVVATLTGVGAYQGQQELRGLELARDEINEAGGIDGKLIRFIVEDSKAEPATAATAIKKLIDVDRIQFVIGDSWTTTTAVMVPIVNRRGVLLISPLATLDDLSKDDMFFRTMPTTKSMMVPLAKHAYFQMNARKLGILRQETPFGIEHARDFRGVFEALGGEVVGEESFAITATDVRTEITKIKDKNPDTIFNLHATGPMMGLLIKQAKELGVNVQWLGSWGSENADLLREYGDIIEGLTYPYPYNVESKNPGVQEFVKAYQHRYNELPDITAANSYDALKVLARGLEECGENTKCVKGFLLSLKDYQGASGIFSFDKNGDVVKPIIIKTIKNGQFVPYEK
ncbi:MAG: hypothetical protein DRI61_14995 [Chloroflexi bacterium]|nr:MAG: hypothetical protein DRI61_14995 [Chloroflexota bacterium]